MFDILQCPKCHNGFSIDSSYGSNTNPRYGLLTCSCSTYPIVCHIPVLRSDSLTKMAVNLVGEGKFERSKYLMLNQDHRALPGRRKLGEAAMKVRNSPEFLKYYLYLNSTLQHHFQVQNSPSTFLEAIDAFIDGKFAEYLMFRPFTYSFWNLHACLGKIKARSGPVLDYGGGWGHSSRLIKATTDRRVFNIDIRYETLYSHSKFIEPNRKEPVGVVTEPWADIPFQSETFGTVIDLDGFHYVENKFSKGSEYERVARDSGQIFLLHAHNNAVSDGGWPLPPRDYSDCFSWETFTFPELDFLSDYLSGQNPFETPNWDGQPQDVNLVIGKEGTEFKTSGDEDPIAGYEEEVIVNPAYTRLDEYSIVRRSLSEGFRREFNFSLENSNQSYELDDFAQWPNLLKRGILTPLPSSYTGKADDRLLRWFFGSN